MGSVRTLAVVGVLLAGLAVAVPAAADGPQSVDYLCDESGPFPTLGAPLATTTADSGDPAAVFQPVTWTFALGFPAITPVFDADAAGFRMRYPIPAAVDVQSVAVVAAPSTTPNPPIADVAVAVTASEIVVDLPKASRQDVTHRVRFTANTGALTYPQTEGAPATTGSPLVFPELVVTGVADTGAAGRRVVWEAPTSETDFTNIAAHYDCVPNPAVLILTTRVSATRHICDGQPITVQVGLSGTTNGPNVIQGTPGNDVVSGLGGNDRFCGLGGNDTFNGGSGNDRAFGGDGNDRLRGDAGADNLQGQAGNDALTGGTERDTCNGGPDSDTATTTCEVRQSIP